MPREVFIAGQILTAAEMNSVSDQTVMVFAGTAARGSAIPTPTEGMVTYLSDSNLVEAYTGAAFKPVSTILQVVSTTKVDTFSTTSTSFVDITGLSASITPSSTSSKIFVVFSVAIVASTNNIIRFELVRDSTAIGGGTPAGSRPSAISSYHGAVGDGLQTDKLGGEFLDSPSTTSSTTYKIKTLTNAGTVFVNRTVNDPDSALGSRLSSTITLMEVAG